MRFTTDLTDELVSALDNEVATRMREEPGSRLSRCGLIEKLCRERLKSLGKPVPLPKIKRAK
jgi:hypothetical protein